MKIIADYKGPAYLAKTGWEVLPVPEYNAELRDHILAKRESEDGERRVMVRGKVPPGVRLQDGTHVVGTFTFFDQLGERNCEDVADKLGTPPEVMAELEDGSYRSTVTGITMNRLMVGDKRIGPWALCKEDGSVLDVDQYSNDLLERHGLRVQYALMGVAGYWLPRQWGLEHAEGRGSMTISAPFNKGYVTIDWARRVFIPGDGVWREPVSTKEYKGRGWQLRIQGDAVAWLQGVLDEQARKKAKAQA